VMMRVARSVSALKDAQAIDGIQVQELAFGSDYAWGETTLDGAMTPAPDEGQDIVGHVPLMAVAEIKDPNAVRVGSITAPGSETRDKPAILGATGAADGDAGQAAAAAEATGAEPPAAVAPAAGATAPEASPEVVRKDGGRVLVVGDSDFASNELLGQLNNVDLVLNSLAWLAGEENQVSIHPNEAAKGALSMNIIEGLIVWLASLLFLPGAMIVGAFAVWRKRRNL